MYIYNFAKNVKNAPIERLTDIIIDSNNACYIYLFTRDVGQKPIPKLASAIMKIHDIDHIYYFIRDVKNAPVEQMIDEVIRTYNLERIWWLSKRMGLSLSKLYCTYSKEKSLAVGIVMKNENKEKVLTNLIDSINQDDNLIKLRVYFDFLVNPESSLEEARRCDKEYKEYIANQKDSSDKTLKKTTNH